MAVHKILRIGHPLLRQKSASVAVSEIRSSEMKKLIKDMFDSMDDAGGIGLAAPQIGVMKRVVIVGFDRSDRYPELKDGIERKILFNPELEVLKSPNVGFWEGCLSVPDMRGYVERSRKIRLKWYDEKEEFHDEIIEGFDAVVYQHEIDHLDGVLYVDRIKDPKLFGYNDELDMGEETKGKVAV